MKKRMSAFAGLALCIVLSGCDFAAILYPAQDSAATGPTQAAETMEARIDTPASASPVATTAAPQATPEPSPGFEEALTGRQAVPIEYVMETSNQDSRYYGKYAVDGDEKTCWTTVAEDGEATLGLRFQGQYVIDGIVLLTGDQRGSQAFIASGRPTKVELIFSEQDTLELTLDDRLLGEAWSAAFPPRAANALALRFELEGRGSVSIAEIAVLTTGSIEEASQDDGDGE